MKIHLPTLTQFASLLTFNISNALFQALLMPHLVNYAGAEKLGTYFVILSFTLLASIFVNFGTSQTAVIDLQSVGTSQEKRQLINTTFQSRIIPFTIVLIVTIFIGIYTNKLIYFLCGLPLIISELLNPQFYLIANYKINKYTVINIILKTTALLALYQIKDSSLLMETTLLVTGFIGVMLNIFFLPRQLDISSAFNLGACIDIFKSKFKTNGLIVGSGLTVQLQQSLFLFFLATVATPLFLSAYGFVDKLISSFRLFVNAYSTAIIPRATSIHLSGFESWKALKKRQNILIAAICIFCGLIMFYFPKELLTILLLGQTKEVDFIQEASILIQLTSPAPLLIGMNLFNVAELMLEKRFRLYFKASIITLTATIIYTGLSHQGIIKIHAGYYLAYIELVCLLVYTIVVKKIRNEKKL